MHAIEIGLSHSIKNKEISKHGPVTVITCYNFERGNHLKLYLSETTVNFIRHRLLIIYFASCYTINLLNNVHTNVFVTLKEIKSNYGFFYMDIEVFTHISFSVNVN